MPIRRNTLASGATVILGLAGLRTLTTQVTGLIGSRPVLRVTLQRDPFRFRVAIRLCCNESSGTRLDSRRYRHHEPATLTPYPQRGTSLFHLWPRGACVTCTHAKSTSNAVLSASNHTAAVPPCRCRRHFLLRGHVGSDAGGGSGMHSSRPTYCILLGFSSTSVQLP